MSEEDRISSLPDDILHNILSSLPPKQMVQTCVLSKRWEHLWCSVPYLNFDQTLFASTTDDFIKFVDSVLLLRNVSAMERFSLSCWHSITDPTNVNSWIKAAINRTVKILHLEVLYADSSFKLTHYVYTCSSLRELKIHLGSSSYLNLPTSIILPHLHIQYLTSVRIQDNKSAEKLFSTCPVLETLIIERCIFHDKSILEISGLRIKNLILQGSLPMTIYISTPGLISLKLHLDSLSDVHFTNKLMSLVDADISLSKYFSESLFPFFEAIQNVQSLALSKLFLEKLADGPFSQVRDIHFHNLEGLQLETRFRFNEIALVWALLNNCSHLQILQLENCHGRYLSPPSTSGVKNIQCKYKLPCLKFVDMENFGWITSEVDFVKFLLQNAPVLEIMIASRTMSTQTSVDIDMMRRIREELLSYPRASPNARIWFM